ncbi:MAG: cytochrome c, partial [Alphaproteobacteria bacterium]|nr:cytochrome c [Alphaproteobacteria bacterium]
GLPLPPPHGGAFMPAFANILSDAQIGDVANYLRTHVAGRPAWSNATQMARKIRRAEKAAP